MKSDSYWSIIHKKCLTNLYFEETDPDYWCSTCMIPTHCMIRAWYCILKHTTTLFALFDHYILSRKWWVIANKVETYHGIGCGAIISQVWPSCWLWGILIMVGCVLSQLKPSERYILSCEKGEAFFTAKNVSLRGLYPILSSARAPLLRWT